MTKLKNNCEEFFDPRLVTLDHLPWTLDYLPWTLDPRPKGKLLIEYHAYFNVNKERFSALPTKCFEQSFSPKIFLPCSKPRHFLRHRSSCYSSLIFIKLLRETNRKRVLYLQFDQQVSWFNFPLWFTETDVLSIPQSRSD